LVESVDVSNRMELAGLPNLVTCSPAWKKALVAVQLLPAKGNAMPNEVILLTISVGTMVA
jgi:hypothetical protein